MSARKEYEAVITKRRPVRLQLTETQAEALQELCDVAVRIFGPSKQRASIALVRDHLAEARKDARKAADMAKWGKA